MQLRKVFDAAQSWIVISLVGMSYVISYTRCLLEFILTGAGIGVNAALISIITEWLSDIKMGYCYDGWWLNQQFCCWEIEYDDESACESWHAWSTAVPGQWLVYVLCAVRPYCFPSNAKPLY